MKHLSLYVFLIYCLGLLILAVVANADVLERSLTLNYQKIQNSHGFGVIAETPIKVNWLTGEFKTNAAGSRQWIEGDYSLALGTTYKGWDFHIFQDGTYEGPTFNKLGRASDLGARIEIPEHPISIFQGSIAVAIFGRNSGRYGSRTARSDLEGFGGYSRHQLDEYPVLADIKPAPTGLPLKADNSLNTRISVHLLHPSGFALDIAAIPEIYGSKDQDALHQFNIKGTSSYELGKDVTLPVIGNIAPQMIETISLQIIAELGLASYQDEIHHETMLVLGLNVSL